MDMNDTGLLIKKSHILGLEHQRDLQPSILQAEYLSLSVSCIFFVFVFCIMQLVLQILVACNYISVCLLYNFHYILPL